MTRDDAAAEARRYRVQLQEARRVIVEYQSRELGDWLAGRLLNPEDFDMFIGRENVVTAAGRIDWTEVETRVRALLNQRPYLAATGVLREPTEGGSPSRPPSRV